MRIDCRLWRKKISQNILVLGAFLLSFLLVIFFLNGAQSEQMGPNMCSGRQWKNSEEDLECRFPPPPIGRWKAVYTAEFAKTHNLPPENISADISPGVDYMEMDAQPYGTGGTACLVNMLIKKPHDVAFYNKSSVFTWEKDLHERRKLLHFLDIEDQKSKLKRITTFGRVPRNIKYRPKLAMSSGSALAFYVEDVLQGYDYISADASCYKILSRKDLFPDNLAFWIAKASIWGKYEAKFRGPDSLGRPKGKDYFDTHFLINISKELISTVFIDMPIGGRK